MSLSPRSQNKSIGFNLFLLKTIDREDENGNFLTVKQAREKAIPTWNKMDKSTREKFRSDSLELGETEINNRFKKRIEKEAEAEKNKREKIQSMQNKIDEYLKKIFYSDPDPLKYRNEVFIVGSVNYFIKHKENYIPGEYAFGKFNIARGYINIIDGYVTCYELPFGSFNDAKIYSQQTHNLPLPPETMGEKLEDHTKALEDFFSDVTTNIIFYNNENRDVSIDDSSSISQFLKNTLERDFIIAPLHRLFYNLLQMTKPRGKVTIELAKKILNENPLELSFACHFHFCKDVPKYCCTSRVRSWIEHVKMKTDQFTKESNSDDELTKNFNKELYIDAVEDHFSFEDNPTEEAAGGSGGELNEQEEKLIQKEADSDEDENSCEQKSAVEYTSFNIDDI